MNKTQILGASAAVFKNDQVLLIQRAKGAYKGLWSLPGGHIKAGETAAQAAMREVQEETAIQAKLVAEVDILEFSIPDADKTLDSDYRLTVFAGLWLSGKAKSGDDAADLMWVDSVVFENENRSKHNINLTPKTDELIIKAKSMISDLI